MIYAGVALLALVLLASTLNTLQLSAGDPLPLFQLAPDVVDPSIPNDMDRIILAVIRVIMILAWIGIPLTVIMLIISKEARKRFLRDMMFILPVMYLLYILGQQKAAEDVAQEVNPRMFDSGPLESMSGDPNAVLPTYQPPADWVTGLVTILLAVGIALTIAVVGYIIYRRSQRKVEPLHAIEQEAQAAIDALEAGGDLGEVIMRCYFQMISALKELKNIQRGYDMTPHEFEGYLEARGMPGPPVHQLTQLFEQVRYGGIKPGRADQRAAVSSLEAIVAACKRDRENRGRETA
jgi:hypothetical protein